MAMAYPKFWILIPIELARAAAATKLATEVPTLPARYARSMVFFGPPSYAQLPAHLRGLPTQLQPEQHCAEDVQVAPFAEQLWALTLLGAKMEVTNGNAAAADQPNVLIN